jgi:hypothetical protein
MSIIGNGRGGRKGRDVNASKVERSGSKTSPLTKLRFLKAALADLGYGLDFAVLFKLVDRCNGQTGQCNPSYDTTAKDVGAKRRAVILATERLERSGWLNRSITGDGVTSNAYSFPWERGRASAPPCTTTSASACTTLVHTDAPPSAPPCTTTSAPPCTLTYEERTSERNSEPNHGDSNAGAFERFWAQYPKKVGKLAAQKAFARAVDGGAGPQDIMLGVARYAAERDGQDPKYTKHPASWLNAGCWTDEPSPPGQRSQNRNPAVAALLRIGGDHD